jgi:hypothetical protein
MADGLYTLAEVGRRLNLADPRLARLHDAGILKEDFRSSSGEILFLASRLPELRAAVKDYGIDRAIKANAERQRVKPITGGNVY